jgi:hypothetical protein
VPLLVTVLAVVLLVVFAGVGGLVLGARTLPREACSGECVGVGVGLADLLGLGVGVATDGDGVASVGSAAIDCGASIRPTVDAAFSSVSFSAPKAPLTSSANTTTAVANGPISEAPAGLLACLPATVSGSFHRG